MNINRHNYEIFVIDYFDDKLDPVLTAELMYFLSQNPDLEYEFNEYENLNLPAEELRFSDKENLKKDFNDIQTVTEDNFEEFCIAETEGILDEGSKSGLYQYLENNPHKYRELELYKKTTLTPDKSVFYPGLKQLKKYRLVPPGIVQTLYYSGIAAAVLLIVFLTIIFRRVPESELITGTMPASEKNKITADESTIPASARESSVNITADTEDSESLSEQNNMIVHTVNDNSQTTAMEDDIVAFNQILKPIEIRKIDKISYSTELTLMSKKDQLQYHTGQPVESDNPLAAFIREKLMSAEIVKSAENLNAWTFAQASIKGINYLTESDIQMNRKLYTNGKMSEITIDSGSFGFSKAIKK